MILIEEANIGIVDVAFGELHTDPADACIDWNAVYRRIRETAVELGVDPLDIAAFLGLDPKSADYQAKYNAMPKMQTALQVATFLGVPAAWIIAGKGQPKHRAIHAIRQGISDTAESTVLQGNTAGTLIINQGQPQMSEQKKELIRIFDALPIRMQTRLLAYAYDMEEQPH